MVYLEQDMCESKLGRRMQVFRADRPSEWLMDEFIDMAENMHKMNKELLAALETVIEWYDMEADHSIEPDFYKRMAACQVSEDMAREAIAKAKAAS